MQTDRRTDILIANAVLNYARQPKTPKAHITTTTNQTKHSVSTVIDQLVLMTAQCKQHVCDLTNVALNKYMNTL